ncbi:MAG: hypothetical protein R3267_07100 [Paenisporosarcina sp.]|nr:hypothetical protein [Paenisporosarcina sp.]
MINNILYFFTGISDYREVAKSELAWLMFGFGVPVFFCIMLAIDTYSN